MKLGNHLNLLQEKLPDKSSTPWHPKEHGVTIKDLKQAYDSWERGILPEDNYLFGLIENHKEFINELLKDFNKVRKINSHISDEVLQDWLGKLKELRLEIDVSSTLEEALKVRGCLRRIFALLHRKDSSKHPHLLGRIIEEIMAWNRKKLTQEEFDQLVAEMDTIRSLEYCSDSKDYDWTQFELKMEGFQWRQQARLVFEDPNADEETIQGLLRQAPRDLKAQKVNEWINLANKAKNVEWMDERKIHERIQRYLNDSNVAFRSTEVAKFVTDALICSTSDETISAIGVFDLAVKAFASNEISGIEHLDTLVKDMIDCKLYQNTLFEHFDSLQSKLKAVKQDAQAVERIRKSLESGVFEHGVTLDQIRSSDRLSYQQVTDLLHSMDSVPRQIAEEVAPELEKLRAESNLFTEFLQAVKPDCEETLGRLAEVQSGSKLAEIQSQQCSLLQDYHSQFTFRDNTLEILLNKVDVLIRGCLMLQSGLPTSEAMDDELDNRNKSQSAPYKEIVVWEDLLSNVKEACRDLGKSAQIVEEIAGPLETAKKFMQVVNNISIGQPTSNNNFIELEDLKIIVLERRQGSEKIKLEDSLRFLEDIILKAEGIQKLLCEEKVELQRLKEALVFMQRIGIQFAHLLEDCVAKIHRAEKFEEVFKHLPKEILEKEFERYTEEYNGLNISIPEVENTFNIVQECRYLRVEADRLLAADEFDLNEGLDVKARLSSMTYFKSPNIIGNLLAKIFYKMREVYEQSDEEQTFVIPYQTLSKLIQDSQKISTSKQVKEETKSNLKEKVAMVSQIVKDVEAHLKKHVFTQPLKSLTEHPPAEIFRNFVNISEQIAQQVKSLEALDDNQLDKHHAPEKMKEELDRLVPREVITQEVREAYIRSWKEPFLQNKSFGLDLKDVSIYSKQLEREIFNRYQSNPTQYEKSCDEIGRVLKEIEHYSAISQHIKSKKFFIKAFSEYFGKSSGDIRQLNFNLAKNTTTPHEPLKSEKPDAETSKQIQKKPQIEEEVKHTEETREGLTVGEYQYYRIFVGDISVQFTDPLKLEKVHLYTCNRAKIISTFTSIPQNLLLSSKCSRETFNDYFGKTIQATSSKNKIMAGYLVSSGSTDRLQRLHQLLLERDVVASKTYSERFKLFVLPREFLLKEWLEVVNIVTMVKDVDLVFFLIYRIPEAGHENQPENTIIPEPLPIAGGKAYKLVFNNKVKDHPLSIELLKEPKKMDKLLPEHIRTKIGQNIPPTDPLATSFTQRNSMDMMKSSDEGMSKVIKNYNKSISNLNIQPGQSTGFHSGASEGNHFGHSRHEPRDSHKDAEESHYLKRYTHHKQDATRGESLVDHTTQKKSPSFETDLLGALQNVKPTRHFSKQTGSYAHGNHSAYSFSSKVSEPINTAPSYNELPSYNQPTNNYQIEGLPKMLGKRPPIVQNPPTILTSLSQSSLGMHSAIGTSHADSHVQPQTSDRKSFLHQAISAIQIPPSAVAGTQLTQVPESKIHQALSKKNPISTAYNPKPLTRPTDLRPSNNPPSLELGQSYPMDQIYKKKPNNPAASGLQGSGQPHGYHSMPFDHLKNQFL
jgi:hypothetical protein